MINFIPQILQEFQMPEDRFDVNSFSKPAELIHSKSALISWNHSESQQGYFGGQILPSTPRE